MAQKKKRGRGRPKLPKAKYKGKIIPIRVTDAEHRRLKAAAKEEEMALAAWARMVMFERLGVEVD